MVGHIRLPANACDLLGGPRATFDALIDGTSSEVAKLKGGWIVGGYLSNWIPAAAPAISAPAHSHPDSAVTNRTQ